MSDESTVTNDALQSAITEAWSAGYDAAITSLRELKNEFSDPHMKTAIYVLTKALEATKP